MALGATIVERSLTIDAPPAQLWALIVDPHHQPRWWPGVDRVEGVGPDRFTQVLRTRRGRPVRVDYSVAIVGDGEALSWRQELAGSPFARVLSRAEIELVLRPAGETAAAGGAAGGGAAGAATSVTIRHLQQLRGSNRTGSWMLGRATRRRLDEALAGLAAIVVSDPPAQPGE